MKKTKSSIQMQSAAAGIWLVAAAVSLLEIIPWFFLVLVAAAFSVYQILRGIEKLDIPFCEIAIVINVLQLIVAPLLAYSFGSPSARYQMAVGASTYFQFVYPAVCLFCAGASLFYPGKISPRRNWGAPRWARNLAWSLLVFGFLAGWIGEKIGTLSFFFFLLSQTQYVAVMVAVRYRFPGRWLVAILGFAPLLITSGKIAMFHDLIIWSAFIILFWYRSLPKKNLVIKLQVGLLGLAFILFAQFIKADFRSRISDDPNGSRILQISGSFANLPKLNRDDWISLINRFNQGWIVSNVMNYISKDEEFKNGESVKDALVGAVLTREIAANKAKAGGRDLFREFTGLKIQDNTSMGIGIVGEAYGNFGVVWSLFFLGLLGACFSILVSVLYQASHRNIIWTFLTPIIIYQAVKAETDMGVVFNQISKGLLTAVILNFLFRRIARSYKRRRRYDRPNIRTDKVTAIVKAGKS